MADSDDKFHVRDPTVAKLLASMSKKPNNPTVQVRRPALVMRMGTLPSTAEDEDAAKMDIRRKSMTLPRGFKLPRDQITKEVQLPAQTRSTIPTATASSTTTQTVQSSEKPVDHVPAQPAQEPQPAVEQKAHLQATTTTTDASLTPAGPASAPAETRTESFYEQLLNKAKKVTTQRSDTSAAQPPTPAPAPKAIDWTAKYFDEIVRREKAEKEIENLRGVIARMEAESKAKVAESEEEIKKPRERIESAGSMAPGPHETFVDISNSEPAKALIEKLRALEELTTLLSSDTATIAIRVDRSTMQFTILRQPLATAQIVTSSADSSATEPATSTQTEPPEPTEEEKEAKRERNRQEVIAELVKTEADYIRDLNLIISVFLTPLREKKNILTPNDMNALFSNVEMIYIVNQELLRDFEREKLRPPHEQCIGKVFLSKADYLRMYTDYCTHNEKAFKVLERLKKKSSFANFLSEAKKNPELQSLPLDAFLIKPVQRICKYPLLIRELIKNTPPTHTDYEALQKALTKVQEVVATINEKKNFYDDQIRVVEISKQINFGGKVDVDLVRPTRKFIEELSVKMRNAKGKIVSRHLFLFNDVLCVCKKHKAARQLAGGKKYKFSHLIPLDRALVWDAAIRGGSAAAAAPSDAGEPDPRLRNMFEIARTDRKKKFVFITDTEEQKTAWVQKLNELMVALPPPTASASANGNDGATATGGKPEPLRTVSNSSLTPKLQRLLAMNLNSQQPLCDTSDDSALDVFNAPTPPSSREPSNCDVAGSVAENGKPAEAEASEPATHTAENGERGC